MKVGLPLLDDHPMSRILAAILLFIALAQPAFAQVRLSFHSFNGNMFGRFPHAFIVLDGTLEANGQAVNENYGYGAVSVTAAITGGDTRASIFIEKPKYLLTTNRHFSVMISDAQYNAVVAEMAAWRDAPGRQYNVNRRNCIHFVARIAEMVGIRAEVPENMIKRPKMWLNFVTRSNPQLGAREIN